MVLLAPLAVPTVPGAEVVGDGLTAVLHDGFPGVLLRVIAPGARSAWIVRQDGEAEVPVRSGAPLRLSTGHGHAYDAEATPGATYRYAALVDGVEVGAVVVRLADYAKCEAWIKDVRDPSRSVRLSARIQHPWGDGDETMVEHVEILGGGRASRGYGVSLRAGSMVVRTSGRAEYVALRRVLATDGPLLLQASREHGIEGEAGLYFVRGRRTPDALGLSDYQHKDTSIDWLEASRPATTAADPLRIPGWGWYESTSGLPDWATYASAYPTTWDQLKAGIAGWVQ